ADAAQALIDQGVDVLMQHTDSTAPMAKAEEAGIMAFGQASDQSAFGPNAHLTSIIDDWGPYYVARTQAVLDGTWESTDTWDGIAPGMVAFADMSDKIPAEVQAEAMQMIEDISTGAYHPFTGPINKQDGSVYLAAGEVGSDFAGNNALVGMNFYFEGIEGDIPN
ncbi:MAG: BMP family ABC transporter substrate-binding protein, partial [Pseudomonadota bacterium]